MAGKTTDTTVLRWRFVIAAVIAVSVLLISILPPVERQSGSAGLEIPNSKPVFPAESHVEGLPDKSAPRRGNLQDAEPSVHRKLPRGQISGNPLIAKAQESLRQELSQAEREKAHVLQYRNTGVAKAWLIAIPAPTEKDIGKASEKMTSILASIPPEQKAEARAYLQLTYNDYMGFGHAFRLIRVMKFEEDPAFDLGEVEVNKIEGVALTERASISAEEEQNLVLPGTTFKFRYSHLANMLNEP